MGTISIGSIGGSKVVRSILTVGERAGAMPERVIISDAHPLALAGVKRRLRTHRIFSSDDRLSSAGGPPGFPRCCLVSSVDDAGPMSHLDPPWGSALPKSHHYTPIPVAWRTAVTHVDGTARLQTVHRETNPRFHRLLKEFEILTGVPVLLNTSFNVMGEPIVESPQDAIRCFFSTGLDYLVLGNYIVGKQPGMLPDVLAVRASATSCSPPVSLDREVVEDLVPLLVADDQPCLLQDREVAGKF